MRDKLDELRHIEGFPLGEDEDLHALSDPPHYTAYPNPHIAEFIQKYGKPYDEATDDYHREPYVADTVESKNDPIYNMHTYHTKVPHKAIAPFIEHYTNPGDIIFDGFCGTGMTGIAAQMTGRKAILSDLSPVATFISHGYNLASQDNDFEREAREILADLEKECGWMYETMHTNGKKGRINYMVWSDIFLCPYCGHEINYFWETLESKNDESVKSVQCKNCNAKVIRKDMLRAEDVVFDSVLKREIKSARRVPVLISYVYANKKYEKKPDGFDYEIIRRLDSLEIPYWFPSIPMLNTGERWGDSWRAGIHFGITHIHHFYTKRSLWVYASIWNRILHSNVSKTTKTKLLFWAQSLAIGQTHLNRYFEQSYSQVNRFLKGTMYIGPKKSEVSPWYAFPGKIRQIAKSSLKPSQTPNVLVSTSSATQIPIPENSVDYIFTDPPFGSNIAYSDLNFIWESWLKVWTNTKAEAIISEAQSKELDDYRGLIARCFERMYSALKPGRWITVVFHNSKASVWNAIQDSLAKAGFIVAQVVTLDKKQETKVQMTSAGAVKNDLVINAYKPRFGFTQRFISWAGHGLEVDFTRQHLRQLPVAANAERSKEMLYSKYLAYYVQHGYQVQYNGEQFYHALPAWGLVERDGYWFADEAQAQEYEQRKAKTFGKKGPQQQAVLFISDEKSARQWLWDFLKEPKSYDEIYTAFVKALQTSQDDIPEVKSLLEESFVRANGDWKRPDALTQAELDKKRQERLLRQFDEYLKLARTGQKLKEVRLEALVIGFTEAYRASRFQDILTVSKKLEKRLLEESPDLLDFVDIAETKLAN